MESDVAGTVPCIGNHAIEVQQYVSNAIYTVNLLHSMHGVSHFNVLRGPSNGLELLNFFEEALKQEDVFANHVIKENDVIVMVIAAFIMVITYRVSQKKRNPHK